MVCSGPEMAALGSSPWFCSWFSCQLAWWLWKNPSNHLSFESGERNVGNPIILVKVLIQGRLINVCCSPASDVRGAAVMCFLSITPRLLTACRQSSLFYHRDPRLAALPRSQMELYSPINHLNSQVSWWVIRQSTAPFLGDFLPCFLQLDGTLIHTQCNLLIRGPWFNAVSQPQNYTGTITR